MDTLAVRLTLPTAKRVADFHRRITAHFGQTKENVTIFVSIVTFRFGGGDESRTRVRKSIHATFYERSLSTKIPNKSRRQTGCYHR